MQERGCLVLRRSKKKRKINPLFIIIIIGLIWIGFNDSGFIKKIELAKKEKQLINELKDLYNQENLLLDNIDKLNNDLDYIEKLAYEKFHMVKPGEKIYKVKDQKNQAQ